MFLFFFVFLCFTDCLCGCILSVTFYLFIQLYSCLSFNKLTYLLTYFEMNSRKSRPELVADVVVQSLRAPVANDRPQMGVLQSVPDLHVIVLVQRVEVTA